MLSRRATALFLALVTLAGFGAMPAAAVPSLVCAMTGLPMPAAAPLVEVAADEATAAPASCCHPAATAATQGDVDADLRSTLERASCCTLQQAPDRDPQPATFHSISAPVALLMPAPSLPRPLVLTASATRSAWASEAAPRGPPLSDTPSRAPPAFS